MATCGAIGCRVQCSSSFVRATVHDTCLPAHRRINGAGVVVLALTVSVVETKLALSEKATMALRWQAVDSTTLTERRVAAAYIQRLWRMKRAAGHANAAGNANVAHKLARQRAIVRSVCAAEPVSPPPLAGPFSNV